jgi:hypothetical protein
VEGGSGAAGRGDPRVVFTLTPTSGYALVERTFCQGSSFARTFVRVLMSPLPSSSQQSAGALLPFGSTTSCSVHGRRRQLTALTWPSTWGVKSGCWGLRLSVKRTRKRRRGTERGAGGAREGEEEEEEEEGVLPDNFLGPLPDNFLGLGFESHHMTLPDPGPSEGDDFPLV